MKAVMTTGEIARICKVAPRTATSWIDDGLIKGGYRIPGSKDRRVPVSQLRSFMEEYNMPGIESVPITKNVLLVGLDLCEGQRLSYALMKNGLSFDQVENSFAAGLHVFSVQYESIVIDFKMGFDRACAMVSFIRKHDTSVLFIGLLTEMRPISNRKMWKDIMDKPYDPALLSERISSLLKI